MNDVLFLLGGVGIAIFIMGMIFLFIPRNTEPYILPDDEDLIWIWKEGVKNKRIISVHPESLRIFLENGWKELIFDPETGEEME